MFHIKNKPEGFEVIEENLIIWALCPTESQAKHLVKLLTAYDSPTTENQKPMPLTKTTLLAIAAAITAVANDLDTEPTPPVSTDPGPGTEPKPRGRPRKDATPAPVEAEPTHPTPPLATAPAEQPKPAEQPTMTVTVEDLKAAATGLIKGGKGALVKQLIKESGGESFTTTPDANKPSLLAAIQQLAKEVSADEFS